MTAEILLSVDSHAVVRKNIERSIYCSPNFPECCVLAQLCLTLCDPTDCSPPGSSVHGIFQARNTGAGYHFLLQGSSRPKDQTRVSCFPSRFFITEKPKKESYILQLKISKLKIREKVTGQYPWWTYMQISSINYQQAEFYNTLKGSYTMILWDLFQGCKGGLASAH